MDGFWSGCVWLILFPVLLQMQTLEESHGLSARHPNDLAVKKFEPQDECKSISLALEEVHHKGTLVDRVAILENRLLQVASTNINCFKRTPSYKKT